jgi:tyrosine-protein phosphatase SIW14
VQFRTLLSACAAATFFATPSLISTTAHASGDVPRLAATAVSRIRIDNFGQIDAHYFRGSQPEGRDYADLAATGVKTVIDLQADGTNGDERRLVEAAGMKFYRIPMTTRVPPTPEQLTLFMQIVNDPALQPVYVHCKGGRHRTGVMTAIYRMEHDNWTADQAFLEMKRYKFGMDLLHPEFKRFVYDYRPARSVVATAVQAKAN